MDNSSSAHSSQAIQALKILQIHQILWMPGYPGNYLFRIFRINYVNGPYEFLVYLDRLMAACRRFERYVWALNAIIISVALYALATLLGLSAFARFHWQDSLLLAASPAILSAALGIAGAIFISRRKKPDLFPLLGPELEEKARTAYDNRLVTSFPMQSLAAELKTVLSKIKPSSVQNQRRINVRLAVLVILSGITILIAQSQIDLGPTPGDWQPIIRPIDKVLQALQHETPSSESDRNLSPNLYGKPSLAVLSENKMELVLDPGVGAGTIARNTQPVERAFQPSSAGEAAAVPAELYIESLPPQNREIIKTYFQILNSGSFSP
jgi:hypothetical protein